MKNLLITLTEYKSMKAKYKAMEEELKAMENDIKQYMKEQETNKLTCGQYVATITECTRKTLDEKAIRELFPDIAKEHEKITTYERFLVK